MGFELEIDLTEEIRGRKHVTCDSCRAPIDTTKPVPAKSKDGKSQSRINPGFQAKLETPVDSGELKDYEFCSEQCLLNYLQRRAKAK